MKAPPSKSMAHRLIIGAALAKGKSIIRGVEYSEDISATLDCAEVLGAKIERGDDHVTVDGTDFLSVNEAELDCRESGSTLRFFIPLCMTAGGRYTLRGSDRLIARPLSVYEKIAGENDIAFNKKDGCITLSGELSKKTFEVAGDVSSQFITGLAFALVRSGSGGEIKVIPPFESRPYVEMTVSALNKFGARITFADNCITIGGGALHPLNIEVEGDWSNAAFLDAHNLIGGSVEVTGLDTDSTQGDRAYRGYFEIMRHGAPVIDVSDTPDLAPILFAMAACLNGATFTGTKRLAAKESDRAAVMAEELSKFGVTLDVKENSVTVPKSVLHAPTEPISKHNDHRVVMACSTLLTLTGGEIEGCEDVRKSYPSYFETIKKLGAKVKLI